MAAKANFVGIRMIQPENHLENTASMKLNPIVFSFGNFETLQISKIHQTFALLWSLLKPFLGQSATVSLYFSPQACLDLTNMFPIPTLWIDPDCLAQRSHQGLKLIPSASLRFCSFIESQKIKPHKSSEQLPQKCVFVYFFHSELNDIKAWVDSCMENVSWEQKMRTWIECLSLWKTARTER